MSASKSDLDRLLSTGKCPSCGWGKMNIQDYDETTYLITCCICKWVSYYDHSQIPERFLSDYKPVPNTNWMVNNALDFNALTPLICKFCIWDDQNSCQKYGDVPLNNIEPFPCLDYESILLDSDEDILYDEITDESIENYDDIPF